MRLVTTLFLASSFVFILAACGAGGGEEVPPPSAPGVLHELAIQGEAAPGTAGQFGVFPTYPHMDAATGGWCAFVAPTTDAAKPEVLYVAQPDAVATLVPVYAIGDPVPAPADGQIAGIDGVWMCPTGLVLTYVSIAGDSGGRTFGVLASLVAGGVAGGKAAVIYDKAVLPAPDFTPGSTLDLMDPATARKEDDGTFWFLGRDNPGGLLHLFSVDSDGTNFVARAVVGANLGGVTLVSVDAFEIDTFGLQYAMVVTTSGGDGRMYLHSTAPGTFIEVAREGDALNAVAGGSIASIHKGGRMVVFSNAQVVWVALGSAVAQIDEVLMFGDAGQRVVLARSGDTAASTGGGQFRTIDMLNTASPTSIPQFETSVLGGTAGVDRATYGVTAIGSFPALGTAAAEPYVDIRNAARPYNEVSGGGSFFFANQAAGGTTGLFWAIPGDTIFTIALTGSATPGGDTFGSFAASSAHTIADGVALFRANLTTAGTGIFRRGP